MREDDGGLTWQQCVSLAETAQYHLRQLWDMVPDISEDEMLPQFLEADIHIGRLVKRARVMLERERRKEAEGSA